MRKLVLTITAMLCGLLGGQAQGFFNLTAEQVKIDSLLPCFTYSYDLGRNFADSTYTVSIDYPEFIPMTDTDIRRYKNITQDTLPAMPVVNSGIGVVRKRGQLDISFVPLVYRCGKYQKLVSFKLTVKGHVKSVVFRAKEMTRASTVSSRYADHSILRNGNWAKIRIAASGVYQLTDALVREAGFSDLSKVKIYGYGGALQPETLTSDYLTSTDDLQEVATYPVGGRRLFYAQGPVTWNSNGSRTRNPYSDYGYYFLTESDDEPASVDSIAFVEGFYPSGEDYNSLYEVDDYSWAHDGFHGGRNLYDSKILGLNTTNSYTLTASGASSMGTVRVVLSASAASVATVSVNDSVVGTVSVSAPALASYDSGNSGEASFVVGNLLETNIVTITQTSGGEMRLDYIAIHSNNPKDAPMLSSESFPTPEFVYRITNQDHHADTSVDMVVIIPTSQQFRTQAERLKELHEQHDNMTVRIIPADELYNEFSSGTPDATAYRRYMKMLYDRAATDDAMPRYLLLFGDGVWDNRMLSSECRSLSPDDFLICFESENSFSQVNCYVSDDFYCMLDDGESLSTKSYFFGKPDVAVGRLSARTLEQATTMVDKIDAYLGNAEAGSWKNTVVVMGDDGDQNVHMKAADEVAATVEGLQPTMEVKRIMWDAYARETSSTGFRYPDVEKLIERYMTNGALVMNYNGHGSATDMSHEYVLQLTDFQNTVSKRLPLWVTASCDISPFDGQKDNIGEEAMYNENGGAVAFYGTTRTVYTDRNLAMNRAFTKHLFSKSANGERNSIGEAARLAKVELVTPTTSSYGTASYADQTMNKLHYVLLGDPALVLSYPEQGVVIDSINGVDVASNSTVTLKAGSIVSVAGHMEESGQFDDGFVGTLTVTVYDVEKEVVCRLNNTSEADEAFTFKDRSDVVFRGSDSISNGRFAFKFVVPKDISYSEGNGRMLMYAVNNDRTKEYNGETTNFCMKGSAEFKCDSLGPNIYCYLNSSSFSNGGNVNTTPYFYAEINDEDGINAAGSGIGHDLQLTIDGEMAKTYVLNDYFSFDFGSYQNGTVGYSIPALEAGMHKLQFRAWDVLNNSSTVELTFNVVEGLTPDLVSVDCTKNPATSSTSFLIVHDRAGSSMDVRIEVFDMAGRLQWTHEETGLQSGNSMTVNWDLTTNDGRRLGTGVYLYRTTVSCEGGDGTSKTKKLIILSNK